ncbi:hypothetical protein GCM10023074_70940 [Microbispora amethystogenes]
MLSWENRGAGQGWPSDRESPRFTADRHPFWHASGTPSLACAYVFGVTSDSYMGRRLEPVVAKTEPAVGKAEYVTPALLLGAVPLLFANWFICQRTPDSDPQRFREL